MSLSTCTFPSEWKKGIIVPVYKDGSKDQANSTASLEADLWKPICVYFLILYLTILSEASRLMLYTQIFQKLLIS
ncbi:uncharacterized protein LOC122510891 isoform X2 [Leptopilina heterotoma]|uniref:uncharacterized protein LOC122510891 isoform X2 n=1 Tax=Leptopilina heterotoma TaxID=63436 RepID=UPI001CA89F03|nr:uncharacterized protein LOC122510891 isoform X2 [Leptopilina heterotoma]